MQANIKLDVIDNDGSEQPTRLVLSIDASPFALADAVYAARDVIGHELLRLLQPYREDAVRTSFKKESRE